VQATAPLTFRKTEARDIPSLLRVRSLTRQNAVSEAQLREWGITPESIAEGFASGVFYGRVCEAEGSVVGFCTGNLNSGEIIVLAVLPEFEGKKIGLTLLNGVEEELNARKVKSIWLACSADPQARSHGFYRANGWVPNGEVLSNGDEILVCTDHCETSRSCPGTSCVKAEPSGAAKFVSEGFIPSPSG
jgi:ribosomal protein S18 acetylase RimI-like enzyme